MSSTSRRTAILAVPILLLGLASSPSAAEPAGPAADDLSATPLEPTDRVAGSKAPSSRLAQTPGSLLRRTDARPTRVMIKLDYDATASYQGGIEGLAPTSPSATGRSLTGTSGAEKDYRAYLAKTEKSIVADLEQAVPSIEVGRSFRTVYGGVAAVIPANSVERVLEVDGVIAVQPDKMNKLLTDSSPEFVNADAVYDELDTTENAGAGVIYGNLDSGVWPEHPSFSDLGNLDAPPATSNGQPRKCEYGENPLTPANDPFVCQNKLIGGAHFTDTYDAAVGDDVFPGTSRDSNGHGTHTSSTTAGNIVDDVSILGAPLPDIQGLAPGAWVMEYKVCGPQGCFGSDSAAAVQQAILDGVDVINFSISGGTQPFSDPVELAFLDAYAAGVFVSTSAGNDGPDAGTANHLAPWVTTVAASTQQREFATTLNLTADNGDTFTADGASITPGVDPALPVVMSSAAPYSDALCEAPAPAGVFTGKIVACERGGNARVDKGFNVLQGGAAGMILFNPTLADVETDTHWLPSVHLADGTDFVAFISGHSGVTGTFADAETRDGLGDVMAAFSSRGPAGNFLKPDVTAPGVQILAGDTPIQESITSGPPGELFQAIAGTSMSSPHVAGAAALVRAVHPTWTPGQIKSALMTTAITEVVKEDTTTPADPFDLGAGRIDVGASVLAPLTIDETAENFFALGNDPVNAVHLNLPSVNAPVMPGRLTTTRVVTNASSRLERVTVSTDAPPGSDITVFPKSFLLGPRQSRSITITITSDATIGAQQFGSIELKARGGPRLHLPVAFIHTQGDVNLTQTCTPPTIDERGVSDCTVEAANNSFEEQVVDLDTFTDEELKIVDADGATVLGPHHASRHNVVLAGAEPAVPAVDPGASPAGYLPLDGFGIAPIPVGDEEIVNFNVPAFEYAGQTWSQLGVDSNGYLIAGGGSAEDNNCCNLPAGADPARPNNVLAPFWSDLDGTAAPGIFIGTLTDGVNDWLVVEHRVNVFGTTSLRVFQSWIGLNGTEDVSFAYDPANLPADPNGQDFLVGAENSVGQGDMEAVLPTGDLRVTSSDPVPGDRVTYTVTVRGQEPGVHTVRSEMEATGVSGVTVVESDIRVLRR
ncbi:MAG: S8 family serine peptidase [Propionibacteriales bacterium]|nr:S8 family serine peptidase [Propionibacteriales bacterium]